MVVLLINLILAVLADVLADFLLGRLGVVDPLKVVIAFAVGIVVFIANPGAMLV